MDENLNKEYEQVISESEDGIINQVYDIPESKKINIQNINGKITIRGTEEAKITVKAKIKENDFIKNSDIHFEVKFKIDDDGTINIKTYVDKIEDLDYNSEFNLGNFFEKIGDIIGFAINKHRFEVEYEVFIPEGMNISCDNKSGRYIVENFSGKANLRTMNGRMNIKNVDGELNLITYNGRVEAEEITGKFNAESYNGRIVICRSTLSELTANTKNGRVVAQFKPLELDNTQYKLKTMNGRIIMAIPTDSSIKVLAKTNMGKIIDEINGEVLKTKFAHNQLEREFGGDTYKVEAMTMHGKIVIKDYEKYEEDNSDDDFDWEFENDFNFEKPFVYKMNKFKDKKKKDKDVSEEVKMILEMVKEGKITSEEGEKLIKTIKE